MPRSFVDVWPNASDRERAAEDRIAQAYWDRAVTLIQWRYSFGSPLPTTPPDDFQISAPDSGGSRAAQDSRLRYWRRLGKLWDSPDTWITLREWSTRWLTDPVRNSIGSIREYARQLIKTG